NDFLLLGSPSKIDVLEPVLTANFQRAEKDLKEIDLTDLYSVASLYLLEDGDLDTFAAGAAMNTDSHPLLEFHAPRFIYANTTDANFAALTSVQKKVPPPAFVEQMVRNATEENHRHTDQMYMTSDSYVDAIPE